MSERLTNRNESGIAYAKIPTNPSNMIDVGECYTGRIIDRLAAYEDTGLTPERIRAYVAELQNAFNILFESERQKQQENEQLQAQVVRVRETLIDYKTFLESFQCTCELSNETYPGVYCERCYRLDQAKQVLAEIDKLSPEEVQEIVKVKADGRMVERGTWINGYCSNCNSPIPTDNKDDYIAKNECRFCYYCGAKMEEAAEKALVEGKEVE